MVSSALEMEIREQLDRLPLDQQRQVLDFARALAVTRPVGVPGTALLRFAGTIAPDDLATMAQAIEEGCETIDPGE
jgi:hypothetical protein